MSKWKGEKIVYLMPLQYCHNDYWLIQSSNKKIKVFQLYNNYCDAEELFEFPAEKQIDNGGIRRISSISPHVSLNRSISSCTPSKPNKSFYLRPPKVKYSRMPKVLGKDSLREKSIGTGVSFISGKLMDEAKSYGLKDQVLKFASEPNQKAFIEGYNCFMSKVKRAPSKKAVNTTTHPKKGEQFNEIIYKLTHKFEPMHNLMKDCDSYISSFQDFIAPKPFKSKYYEPPQLLPSNKLKHSVEQVRPSTCMGLKNNEVRGFICTACFLEDESMLAIEYVSHIICVFKLALSERGTMSYEKQCTIKIDELGTAINMCKNTLHLNPFLSHSTSSGKIKFYEILDGKHVPMGELDIGHDVIQIM